MPEKAHDELRPAEYAATAANAAPDAPDAAGALWRNPRFRLIWLGQTTSIFGDRVTGLALPWLILLQTHSPFDAGLVAAARYLPPVTLGLVAGVLADKISRHALMIGSDLLRMLALASVVTVALASRQAPLWLLVVLTLALGVGQLGFQVAYSAWIPDVTGEGQVGRATAALEASDAASTLAGPPLGGALISALGPALALGADALSYLISALTLLGAHEQRASSAAHTEQAPRAQHAALPTELRAPLRTASGEALAGVRFILTTPAQRLLKTLGAALYLETGVIELLLATLTQLRLHLPAWQAGVIFGAAGVGGLIGSAFGARLYRLGWRRSLAGALAVATLGCIGLALASVIGSAGGGWSFALAFAANLLFDGAMAIGFILSGTANTLVTPREVRGRVNAASTVYSSLVRGAGALVVGGDPAPAFLALIAVFVGAALIALLNSRRPWRTVGAYPA